MFEKSWGEEKHLSLKLNQGNSVNILNLRANTLNLGEIRNHVKCSGQFPHKGATPNCPSLFGVPGELQKGLGNSEGKNKKSWVHLSAQKMWRAVGFFSTSCSIYGFPLTWGGPGTVKMLDCHQWI